MHSAADTLIPARFLLLTSHFIATVIIANTKDTYIWSSLLVGAGSYDSLNASLVASLVVSFLCFIVELGLLLYGATLFKRLSIVGILAHFCGTVASCLMIVGAWTSASAFNISMPCSLMPALLEIVLVVGNSAATRGIL